MIDKKIFTILITHNGEEDIEAFIKTYTEYTPAGVQLVVVDNASSDRTVDIVREQMPDALVVQNTINRGFAGGAREGMEYALSHNAEYIGLVNQDLRFSTSWLEPLTDYLDTHDRCAAVQPRIMLYPQTDIINSYGNAQHYLGFGYTLSYQKKESLTVCEQGKELASCSGATTVFRASALRVVGPIDEKLFLYYEDSDLSWRLRLAGYSLALCCDSTVYHRYEFSRSIQKFYYMERNRITIMLANYSLKTVFLIAPMVLVMEAGMVGYSMFTTLIGRGNGLTLTQKLRSYGYFFCPSTWRYLAQKRHAAQRMRRVSDRALTELFVTRIEFQDIDNPILRRIVNPLTTFYWSWIRNII